MSLGALIAGGIGLKLLHDALSESDADHDDVLEEAYHELNDAKSPGTELYPAHIQDRSGVDGAGHPKGELPNVTGVPDLLAKGFSDNNLVIEVETGDTLNSDAVAQLEDFATPGYTRVLVVPDDVLDDGARFVEESLNGERVFVSGPSDLPEFL